MAVPVIVSVDQNGNSQPPPADPPQGTIDWIDPPDPNPPQPNHYFESSNADGKVWCYIEHPANNCNSMCQTLMAAKAQKKQVGGTWDVTNTVNHDYGGSTHGHIKVTSLKVAP